MFLSTQNINQIFVLKLHFQFQVFNELETICIFSHILQLLYDFENNLISATLRIIIKTHGSESRGQEEAACIRVFWPTRPLQ